MEPAGLIVGISVSLVSLCVRWRFPSVPNALATFGIVAGLGAAGWSFTAVPVGLAASLIANAAFAAAILDYSITREAAPQAVAVQDDSEREQQRAIEQIAKAIKDADFSTMHTPPPELLRLGKATLNSAFMTLKKVYNIPAPMIVVPSKALIDEGVHFLLEIQPYLEGHHVEAAGKAAVDFLKKRELLR